MRIVALFLLAGLAMAQGPTYEPVASIGQLMQAIISPAQRTLGAAAKDAGPADEATWATVRNQGLLLQETAQLLVIGGRAKDTDAWVKDAKALQDAGAAVQKAGMAKDVAALQAATTSLNQSCQGCHSVYRGRGGRKQ